MAVAIIPSARPALSRIACLPVSRFLLKLEPKSCENAALRQGAIERAASAQALIQLDPR
jgi:hypothetical protein